MNHSFNVEIAEKYGIEKAVLLENFYFWVKKNQANKKDLHDGKAYTYNTAEALAELFPYIKARKIAQLLREMEFEDGLLMSGQFHCYNRTKSYTLTDSALALYKQDVQKNDTCNIQKDDNQTSKKCNIKDTKNVGCLNTDINTDKKQDINIKAKKPKGQHKEIYTHYFENYTKLFEQGKLRTDKASVNYEVTGSLIKNLLLQSFTLEEIILVLDRAMADDWIVGQGYSLNIILAAGQVNKLLNAKPQTKAQQHKTDWTGQATDAEYLAGSSDLDNVGF